MDWLLLLHQIPPTPGYLRAKVMKRLNQIGSLPIKNSAYLLPSSDDAVEDLEWIRREIKQGGGDCWVFRCSPVSGWSDPAIQDEFRKLRTLEYDALAADIRAQLTSPSSGQLNKLKRRLAEIRNVDFFDAPGRDELEALMKEVEEKPVSETATGEYANRVWVTRRGVKVDRIGSSWLIRRFIDPQARFVFVDPHSYNHKAGELRFDMLEGEFTHEGDLCTFEVLLRLAGSDDPALQAVSKIVHDIDLKEDRYQLPETAGIAKLIEGIALRYSDDEQRLQAGATIFDALYAQMASRHGNVR